MDYTVLLISDMSKEVFLLNSTKYSGKQWVTNPGSATGYIDLPLVFQTITSYQLDVNLCRILRFDTYTQEIVGELTLEDFNNLKAPSTQEITIPFCRSKYDCIDVWEGYQIAARFFDKTPEEIEQARQRLQAEEVLKIVTRALEEPHFAGTEIELDRDNCAITYLPVKEDEGYILTNYLTYQVLITLGSSFLKHEAPLPKG